MGVPPRLGAGPVMTSEKPTRISLGMFLDRLPWKYDRTRGRRSAFLDRLRDKLAGELFPSIHHSVRGDSVAADSFIRALIRCSLGTTCHFFTSHNIEMTTLMRLEGYRPSHAESTPLSVKPAHNLLEGMDQYNLDAWFDVSASFPLSLEIRRNFSNRLYAITQATHGLSIHSMLHDYFLRTFLAGPLACDSLVCASRASEIALKNILDYVADEFNREFGTHLKYQGRIDRVPACVDTEALRPRVKAEVRKRLALSDNRFIILYLGYLSLVKSDLVPLLRSWQSLVKENPGRKLLFIVAGTGEPTYVARLKSCVRSLGLAKHVRLMLDIDDATKELLFPSADVFVSPVDTVQETFGLAPVEAMACGVPQIVSDWNGYRDTIAHGETGFLLPTRWMDCADLKGTGSLLGWSYDHACLGQSVAIDLKAFKASIQALIDNEDLRKRMSENSRRRAECNYSMPVVIKQYEALWLELSAIAHTLPPGIAKRHGRYTQPAYFHFFGHYSSSHLDYSTPLSLTCFGKQVTRKNEPLPLDLRLQKAGLLDQALLQSALLKVADAEGDGYRASDGPTFGSILRLLSENNNCKEDYLRRHLMWLIKYGLLEISEGEAR